MIDKLSFFNICSTISLFKALLLNSYISTDFDVHRNWMAITLNLPISKWYYDTTSQWTLDYPPLFAAFEYLLGSFSQFFTNPEDLALSKDPIRNESIINYQKFSVIYCDSLYYIAVYQLCSTLESIRKTNTAVQNKDKDVKSHETTKKPSSKNQQQYYESQDFFDAFRKPDRTSAIALLLLFLPGLIFIDHIHFQYNGFLNGFFLLAIARVIDGKFIQAAFWFSLLLNLKHIYLYAAPAFGIYFITSFCIGKSNGVLDFLSKVLQLALVVITVFAITFAPFANYEVLKQILRRLFPFKRGLTHAYWAPNAWALYNTVDKCLSFYHASPAKTVAFMTNGLVQENEHQHLPNIDPVITFSIVAALTMPMIIKLFVSARKDTPKLFIKSIVLACFTSFMFGWHVHEKAILMVLIPLIPATYFDSSLNPDLLRLTLAGTYSFFPLLFEPAEYPIKVCLLVAYYAYAKQILESTKHRTGNQSWFTTFYKFIDQLYVLGFILIEIFIILLNANINFTYNPLATLNKYEFLPLMLVSTYCALGISYSYLWIHFNFYELFE